MSRRPSARDVQASLDYYARLAAPAPGETASVPAHAAAERIHRLPFDEMAGALAVLAEGYREVVRDMLVPMVASRIAATPALGVRRAALELLAKELRVEVEPHYQRIFSQVWRKAQALAGLQGERLELSLRELGHWRPLVEPHVRPAAGERSR